MIDEIGAMIVGFISGNSANRSKKIGGGSKSRLKKNRLRN